MKLGSTIPSFTRFTRLRRSPTAVLLAGCVVAVALLATPSLAASIPAWLDDAIEEHNKEEPALPISFVDIKDSYVWYMIPDTADVGSKEIRTSIYDIVHNNGYKSTDDEERVTTGKPPSPVAPYKAKKCWTRSFVMDIKALSNTKPTGSGQSAGLRQRMLTSLVCEDDAYWFAGFRILQ